MKMTACISMFVFVIGNAGAIAATPAGEQDQAQETAERRINVQTTCPVMGGTINKSLYVDHDGRRIYVCCKGCIGKVKENPEKYIAKLLAAGVTPARIQTTCPVMGGTINKSLYVDHDGRRIYVCCKGCIAKVQKTPEKYLSEMDAAGVIVEPVPDPDKKGGRQTDARHPRHKGQHH